MLLTSAQKTTLKTHMTANTNTTPAQDAAGNNLVTPFVINTNLDRDPSKELAIAAWYNGQAQSGDNQSFANRNMWQTAVTIAMMNSGIDWTKDPVGADSAALTAAWVKWQTMIWNMQIDMSDAQVRGGVLQIFGDTANGIASGVGKVGCGRINGTRVELALAGGAVGAATNAWAAAHVAALDASGRTLLGQKLSQSDVDDVLANG